jgi:hypothetical protein
LWRLKSTPNQSEPESREVECDLAAYASVRATPDQLVTLRRQPGPVAPGALSASFLKNSDEQTVAGLAAVFHAIHNHLPLVSFADWAVLGAPCFLGRAVMAHALQRFHAEGAWGVSPHLAAHRSLHSLAGTVSLALKSRGPNFGVGGGPGSAAEALLAAAALLDDGRVPGVWVVLSGWQTEPIPEPTGKVPGTSVCAALALALVPAQTSWPYVRLRIRSSRRPSGEGTIALDLFRLEMLLAAVVSGVSWTGHSLGGGRWLELEHHGPNRTIRSFRGSHREEGAVRAQSWLGAGAETQR